MKRTPVVLAAIGMCLAACNTMNRPISSGDFDPLGVPGSGNGVAVSTSAFSPGKIVTAAMNNTAFFLKRPKGDADADKLLNAGTSMKVISQSDGYVKVELDGSGEVGWVPSVQLEDPAAAAATGVPFSANPGEYQIYPPVGGIGEPLPLPDSAGLPPEGAIPTVIDPDAPATGTPVPKVSDPTEPFDAPKKDSAPLPPNGEELGVEGHGGAPAEKTPAEKTPAEKTPAEKTPAEKTPAEANPE